MAFDLNIFGGAIGYEQLQRKTYTGRGLVLGSDSKGHYDIQATWLTGRSPDSRNRYYVKDSQGSVRVEVVDESQVDPEKLQWIKYRAMAETSGLFVASNGVQTETILRDFAGAKSLSEEFRLYDSMFSHQYEDDKPIYTPRISGVMRYDLNEIPIAEISLLRRGPSGRCGRSLFSYDDLLPGLGYCIHTYEDDGEPPPAFKGEPYLISLKGDSIEAMANHLWEGLHPKNRVALALKWVDVDDWSSKVYLINTQQPGT